MIVNKIFSLFLLVSFFQTSCNTHQQTASENSSKNSGQQEAAPKSFSRKYSGITPCADCPGIETTVVFSRNSVFIETLHYLERNVSFSDTGKWSASNKMITVTFPESKRFFLIKSDSTIAMLDADQKEIEGGLAEKYILKRKE
jgi:uncharacterized lipoprotein NlpE involved in copper resistance